MSARTGNRVLSYYQCLAGLAVLFIALERVWPRVADQRLLRCGWLSDAAYIVFNSKYVGILLGYVTVLWLGHLNAIFARACLAFWPWWAQFVALLVSIDFVKWSIHNLLHRSPWLWEFHKVHHSIVEMDWMGDWRFHWGEMLVYNALLYAPTALLGASAEVALAVGVFDTLIGHFAHANLRWRIGWLKVRDQLAPDAYLASQSSRWRAGQPEFRAHAERLGLAIRNGTSART